MLIRDFMRFMEDAPDNQEICIAVSSIETEREIAVTYDITVSIGEYGELVLCVAVEAYNALRKQLR
jgi:hypothetical protein